MLQAGKGIAPKAAGERLPGNSENIRFTVAVSGELSRIRMSRQMYAIGREIRIDW
jgi:hypothetical protein